jgi:hypothetical protein
MSRRPKDCLQALAFTTCLNRESISNAHTLSGKGAASTLRGTSLLPGILLTSAPWQPSGRKRKHKGERASTALARARL